MIKTTRIFILSIIVIAILYDLYAFNTGGTESTISWVIMEWSYSFPAATFAAGFLCGHLFWQMKKKS